MNRIDAIEKAALDDIISFGAEVDTAVMEFEDMTRKLFEEYVVERMARANADAGMELLKDILDPNSGKQDG